MVFSIVLELWIGSLPLEMEDSLFQIEVSKPLISNTLVSLLLLLKYTLGRWSWKLMRKWSVATYTHLGRTYSHTNFARCANLFLKNLNNGFVSKKMNTEREPSSSCLHFYSRIIIHYMMHPTHYLRFWLASRNMA